MKACSTLGIRDLRQHLRHYVQRAGAGKALNITEHGVLVARLGPLPVHESLLLRLAAVGKVILPRGDLLAIRPLRLKARSPSVSEALRCEREDVIG